MHKITEQYIEQAVGCLLGAKPDKRQNKDFNTIRRLYTRYFNRDLFGKKLDNINLYGML